MSLLMCLNDATASYLLRHNLNFCSFSIRTATLFHHTALHRINTNTIPMRHRDFEVLIECDGQPLDEYAVSIEGNAIDAS